MKIILTAPVPNIAAAFRMAFEGVQDVEIHADIFETVPEFDCMVSAANSFGLMDGGVDAAITAFFGTQLQVRVQKRIVDEYRGEQPVGTAFVIESGDDKHPWLVHAPTMRVPLTIDGTDAVYNATWAALLAIHRHNQSAVADKQIKSVVFPAMGAGCGQVAPGSVARQMKLAWVNFNNPPTAIGWKHATARQEAVFSTTAYCRSAGNCPAARTAYIGFGDYKTFCAKSGAACISPKHQADIFMGAHEHGGRYTLGDHGHGY